LVDLLWDHGLKTWLIGDERSPSFASAFASGWQMQRWVRRQELADLEQENLLGGTVQTAVDWLAEHGHADNWLLWLELGTLQLPWDEAEYPLENDKDIEPEELPWFDPPVGPVENAAVDRLQHTYGGLMQGVDDWFGQLTEFLREQGLYDETLLLLTSDAGLPLGDHGYVGDHRPWLHEELVHLPLIVKLPGKEQAGRRVQQFSQPVDLLPTLLRAFGLGLDSTPEANADTLPGRSLLPVMRGEPAKLREYACAAARRHGFAEWSIRTHQWHLLVPMGRSDTPPRATQLFVKPDDRWEVNNVLGQHPDVAEHLELTLRRFMAAAQAAGPRTSG
jgi:arylsulfatase A-like enzyme